MEWNKRFRNRAHAGIELARNLGRYSNAANTTVVGLTRGGVPAAAALSEELNLPCNVFVSRKISTPEDRRCALGAVTETGVVFLDEAALRTEPWLPRELRRYLEEELRSSEGDLALRRACYRGSGTAPDFHDQTVIIVDDGACTGATFIAAVQSIRKLGARYLIGALPVASERAVEQIRLSTDDLLVLLAPGKMENLGDYYDNLAELSDEEIVACLAARRKAAGNASRETAA